MWFWWGDLIEGDHLEVLDVEVRIMLSGSSRNVMKMYGLDRAGSG